MSIPSVDPEAGDYFYSGTIPERIMLLALLERALMDLKPNVERRVRKDVIAWFEYEDSGDRYTSQFTFSQVVHYLDLSGRQLEMIRERVAWAQKDVAICEEHLRQERMIATDRMAEAYSPLYKRHAMHPYA